MARTVQTPAAPVTPATGVAARSLGARLRGGSRFDRVAALLWGLLATALILYPLAWLFRESVVGDGGVGLGNYAEALGRPELIRAGLNSVWIAGASTIGALLLGLPMAYLVSRTDLPGRRLIRSVAVLTFAAPSYIAALGWILLLGPRGGLLTTWLRDLLGLERAPFTIFGPWGIVFVLALFSYPLILLPTASALDNMDAGLEQAAANLGAGRVTVLRRITLPLITPAVFAGSLLVFVNAFMVFGPVALLGSPVGFDTIPTAMLNLMRFPPRIDLAAVMGIPALAVLAVLLYLQRRVFGRRSYSIVSGKPGQRSTVRLGAWRWPALAGCLAVLALSLGLPFGVLLLTSFRRAIGLPLGPDNLVLTDNYVRLLAQPDIVASFRNSLLLALLAVVASILFALLAAWLVERGTARARGLIPPTMLTPLAFQGAILGIALIIAYARPPFRLGGGLAILFLAYVILAVPLSFSYVQAGMKQLGPEVEEASRSLGASWPQTLRRITVPLLRSSILSVGLLNFVLLFRELETSVFLYTGTNKVAAVVLYNLASESLFQLMGAFSVVLLAINIGVVMLGQRLLGSDFRT